MGNKHHHHHILFAKKSRRATRKAEAHHTLVAHYIMIVNVRIQYTYQPTNIQSKYTIAHITHWHTHTQIQNNPLKCRPRSTLLVTVLLRLQLQRADYIHVIYSRLLFSHIQSSTRPWYVWSWQFHAAMELFYRLCIITWVAAVTAWSIVNIGAQGRCAGLAHIFGPKYHRSCHLASSSVYFR